MASKASKTLLNSPEQMRTKILKALEAGPMTRVDLFSKLCPADKPEVLTDSVNYQQVVRTSGRLLKDGRIVLADPTNRTSPVALAPAGARPTPETHDIPKRKYNKKNAATNGATETPQNAIAAFLVRRIEADFAELKKVIGG